MSRQDLSGLFVSLQTDGQTGFLETLIDRIFHFVFTRDVNLEIWSYFPELLSGLPVMKPRRPQSFSGCCLALIWRCVIAWGWAVCQAKIYLWSKCSKDPDLVSVEPYWGLRFSHGQAMLTLRQVIKVNVHSSSSDRIESSTGPYDRQISICSCVSKSLIIHRLMHNGLFITPKKEQRALFLC